MKEEVMKNEDFIERFRDWRTQWKPTEEQVDAGLSHASKLAELIAPTPLCKVTKVVLKDFNWEQMKHAPRESRRNVMLAAIAFEAFVGELKRERKGGKS